MSHGDSGGKTCKFGHVFEAWEGGEKEGLQKKIRKGEIKHRDDFGEGESLMSMLKRWKYLKFRSSDQGTAYTGMWVAVDELGTSKGYEVTKTSESVHLSPQSNMHAEFMQRKQQAEQNIKQTMQSYQQLMKQKHMLQHDIRKLRSRVEAINSRDEVTLKGDFIELVDSAGGGQGAAQGSLDFLRNNNIYPTIVSDFQEMESVDDLKTAKQKAEDHKDKEEDDFEQGKLSDLPANEKAILRKKYKMYEQWKDLYGSEVERKLDDLKGQMKNIQRSINETEEWLEPYVKDAAMINRMGDDQKEANSNLNIRGNSTMKRDLEFVVHKPMKIEEGQMVYADGKDDATHYRAMIIKAIHVNIASFSQPQTPADGPSAGIVMWYPFFCCEHVFDNFVRPRIDEFENLIEDTMDDYKGNYESKKGDKLKEARQKEEMSVRDLREKVEEELDDDEERVPLELSSNIRRVEDGLEMPEEAIKDKYLKEIDEILDIDLHPENQEGSDPNDEMYTGIRKTLREFTGQTDDYKIPSGSDPLGDFTRDLRFEYYWGLKLDFGMYTMK